MPEGTAHPDLRSFVADLASLGWLRDVDKPVDKSWEIACIARLAIESTTEDDSYAIRFKRVIGHDMPVVLGLFASPRHVARSLGVATRDIWARWSEALDRPIPPEQVTTAPAHEVVRSGDDVDLTQLPVPVWTPGRDRAPYLTTACAITVDREERIGNVGIYRVEVQGPRQLGLSFGSEKQHGAMHRKTWEDAGEPTPVALVVGAPPAVCYAAAAKLRYGVDELTVAGGLCGGPIPVVPCRSHALLVPAAAEIVIEGFLRPDERAAEGPFGEALGYMEDVGTASVLDVRCVTHRREPMFHGLVQQLPPTEGHLLMEMGLCGSMWHYLTGPAKIEGLVDLALVPGGAGTAAIAVSVRQGDRKSARAVLRVLSTLHWGQKVVIVVDDDVDVRDAKSLFWALSSRVDFATDVTIQPDVPVFQRDPSTISRGSAAAGADAENGDLRGSRIVVDATLKSDCMDIALPSRSLMDRAQSAWTETGLPPLTGISRLLRLLESHADEGITYRLPAADRDGG